MIANLCTIALGVLGLLAGWTKCLKHDGPNRPPLHANITPGGWRLLIIIVLLTSIVVWQNDRTQRENENRLERVRTEAINNFVSDMALRQWKAQATSAIDAVYLQSSPKLGLLQSHLHQVIFAGEYFRATNKKWQGGETGWLAAFKDYCITWEASLAQFDAILATFEIKLPMTLSSAFAEANRLNKVFPEQYLASIAEVGLEPNVAKGITETCREIRSAVHEMMILIVEVEYGRRLQSLTHAPPATQTKGETH